MCYLSPWQHTTRLSIRLLSPSRASSELAFQQRLLAFDIPQSCSSEVPTVKPASIDHIAGEVPAAPSLGTHLAETAGSEIVWCWLCHLPSVRPGFEPMGPGGSKVSRMSTSTKTCSKNIQGMRNPRKHALASRIMTYAGGTTSWSPSLSEA